jgi:hypothetical protein
MLFQTSLLSHFLVPGAEINFWSSLRITSILPLWSQSLDTPSGSVKEDV